MKILTSLFALFALFMSCFAQFSYPKTPKSTNDATIIGGLRYPNSFTYQGNPVSRMHGAGDPDLQIWGDTIWVYASQDRKAIGDLNGYGAMDGYHVFSTTDLVNWTNHGEIMHSSDISWARGGFLWAPTAARKNGKYYLYYPIVDKQKVWQIGVAIGDTPIGPFKDIGAPMGFKSVDPKVFIDDDGEAYIYGNTALVAKLKPNMIELAEPPRKITYGSTKVMTTDTTRFGEGAYMHKKDGIYYFSYTCLHNKTNTSMYAMGSSPYGPFEFKGSMAGWPKGGQDHHSIIEFKGQSYYFYHSSFNETPPMPLYKEYQARTFCFDKLYYNKDKTIQRVVYTYGPTKFLKTNAPNGSIILEPAGGSYAIGTTVKVTAKPDLGYAFGSWCGDLSGSAKTTSIVVDADKTITANFVPTPTYSISTASTIGKVLLNPEGGVCNIGDEVIITPSKVFGYDFSSWSGDISSTAKSEKIFMNGNKIVVANYVSIPTYKLTSTVANGIIDFSPTGPIYEENTVVTMTAKPDYGYAFKGWKGNVRDAKNQVTLTMNSNKKVMANFVYTSSKKIVYTTNCGGQKYRSDEGVYYVSDANLSGGTYSTNAEIIGTIDDSLYQNNKFGKPVSYKIPLTNKTYKVTLMYAEIFHAAVGRRVFDVIIEGVKVASSLDVYAKVGKNVAYNETHSVTLTDGELNIEFASIVDNANISAIKIEE